jgi:hypothetical protein
VNDRNLNVQHVVKSQSEVMICVRGLISTNQPSPRWPCLVQTSTNKAGVKKEGIQLHWRRVAHRDADVMSEVIKSFICS